MRVDEDHMMKSYSHCIPRIELILSSFVGQLQRIIKKKNAKACFIWFQLFENFWGRWRLLPNFWWARRLEKWRRAHSCLFRFRSHFSLGKTFRPTWHFGLNLECCFGKKYKIYLHRNFQVHTVWASEADHSASETINHGTPPPPGGRCTREHVNGAGGTNTHPNGPHRWKFFKGCFKHFKLVGPRWRG